MDRDTDIGGVAGTFPDTRMSVVRGGWDRVVSSYWKPAYKYIRIRWRVSNEDAKDLTQAFFTRAIEKNYFDSYDPSRARFSSFVRTCLDRFLANEAAAAGRLKRGGGMRRVENFDEPAADDYIQREWERAVFAEAIEAIRLTLDASRFSIFEAYDLADERPTYRDLAERFSLKETDVINHLAAARRALRRALSERGYGVPL